jgi:putative FmdB family regulatory protein
MPTYEYECSSCGHRYEKFQSITARPEKKCPACGKRTAKRLIGAGASIIFKGSGFYQTDYRSESYKKAAKADAEAVSGGTKDASSGAKEASGGAKEKAADAKGTPEKASKPKKHED